MTSPDKLLDASAQLSRFEATGEPESLRAAAALLGSASDAPGAGSGDRREALLRLWLHLLALLERYLDPAFDPDAVPDLSVEPPPTKEGIQLPAGVEPADIPDPAARATYEARLAAHRAEVARYSLQVELRRLEETARPRVEALVRARYSKSG